MPTLAASLCLGNTKPSFQCVAFSGSALLAIAHSQVGIDVEYIQTRILASGDRTVPRSPERSHLQALPAKARAVALYRCWTRRGPSQGPLRGLLYPRDT